MTNKRRVLVAGGGIAGAVAAVALHRAGWAPRVFEAREQGADERGAFLTVAVNGVAALRDLGLDPDRVLAGGFPTPSVVMSNGRGRRLATLPLGGPAPDGTVTTTIRRADLYAALRAAVTDLGIPIERGRRVVGFTERPNGVTAALTSTGEEGGEEVDGELLVGADGLHSRIRAALNPGGPEPAYLGLLNAGGFTDRPVTAGLDDTPGRLHMAFGRNAFFGWAVEGKTVWWFANPPSREPVRPGDFTPAAWKQHLIDLFAADDLPAADIIRATDDVLGPWNTMDLRRVATWRSARTVLIGDAAHAVAPSSGQGASMAIEDAVTLGRCLQGEGEPRAALERYENLRRARVEKVVAYGRRSGSGKTAGPVGAAIRDAMFPLVAKMLTRNGDPQAWIFDHRV
jgi:FAD-dependent urate hydroxylase